MPRVIPEHISDPRTARGKDAAKKTKELEEAIGIRPEVVKTRVIAKVEEAPAEEVEVPVEEDSQDEGE